MDLNEGIDGLQMSGEASKPNEGFSSDDDCCQFEEEGSIQTSGMESLFQTPGEKTAQQLTRAEKRRNRKKENRQKYLTQMKTGIFEAPKGFTGERREKWLAKKVKKRAKLEKRKNLQVRGELLNRLVISMNNEVEDKVFRLLESFKAQTISHQRTSNLTIGTGENKNVSSFQVRFQNHLAQSAMDFEGKKIKFDPKVHGIVRRPHLDRQYGNELKAKEHNSTYQQFRESREKLPAYQMRKKLIETIEQNQVVVISGETGCGKTTQIPQLILDSYIESGKGSLCSIVCTQPRRISAISVAERVAKERVENQESLSVGYQVRLTRKFPRQHGSILYCTTGIVLKFLESDQFLGRLSHIILDEVHERDVLTDFLLIILKDLLTRRADLKLILMSASVNAQRFSKYFGNCSMLTIPGFTYPVEELFLEDALQETKYVMKHQKKPAKKKSFCKKVNETLDKQMLDYEMGPFINNLKERYSSQVIDYLKNMDEEILDIELIVYLVKHICVHKPEGAILVFLPGWDHINEVHKLLLSDQFFSSGKCIFTLHSMMPILNQQEVFKRPPLGTRKIILATNIAETSITIDDVVYVIDCGKVKIKNFDVKWNLPTLKPEWVSKANAQQRKGRAGRVKPGVCYHLYTSYRHNLLDPHQLPEMLRTRLEEICLQIKLLQLGRIVPFLERAMDEPKEETLKLSIEYLQTLNALDGEENLTPLGFYLSRLPVDPQTGKMILFGAIFSCLDPISSVAATLGFKDGFYTPIGKTEEVRKCKQLLAEDSMSDHIMSANILQTWKECNELDRKNYCAHNYLSSQTLEMLANMKEQFIKFLQDLNFANESDSKKPELNRNSNNLKLVKAVICAGLYPNVAKVKNPVTKKRGRKKVILRTKSDKQALVSTKSINAYLQSFPSPWMVFHQKLKSDNTVYIYDCTVVPPCPLLLFGGNLQVVEEGEHTAIYVDNWIRFWCSKSLANLIMDLRKELDNLLEEKINNPGPTDWSKDSKEGALLEAIVELLASEEIMTNKLLESSGLHKEDPEDIVEGVDIEEEVAKFEEEAAQFEEEAAQFEEEAVQFDEDCIYKEGNGCFDENVVNFELGAQMTGDSEEYISETGEVWAHPEGKGLPEDDGVSTSSKGLGNLGTRYENNQEDARHFSEETKRFEAAANLFIEEATRLDDEAARFEEEAARFELEIGRW